MDHTNRETPSARPAGGGQQERADAGGTGQSFASARGRSDQPPPTVAAGSVQPLPNGHEDNGRLRSAKLEKTSGLPAHPKLTREAALEIDNFEAEVARFQRGELSPERFRAFRLSHGVYGQRQPGVQMIRVKIPAGGLDGRQLRRLADIADAFSPTGLSHLTTRQDVQFHYVPMERVPHLLRLLAEVGLTTREACGNSVRNVTACPLTGFIADELFDVQPYARAAYAYLVRNPFSQQLARKFKIAFSSCPEDCASTAIHDIGFVGRSREENGSTRFGFKVLVGGGLGATPFTAQVLEEFVPLESLLITLKGIIEVFSAHGDRRHKMKARLKFVVHKKGIETFRRSVRETIAALAPEEIAEAELERYLPEPLATAAALHLAGRTEAGPNGAAASLAGAFQAFRAARPAYAAQGINKGICGAADGGVAPGNGAFQRWQSTNVRAHKNPTRAVVTVVCPLGDLDAPRLRALARCVTAYGSDRARVAISQNLVLPDVEKEHLESLYEGLAAQGLAEASAGTALDVTSCPGADTCAIGITSSKGLARAIRSELLPMYENGGSPALRGVTIKISGCPNSCGQHHVANIGFHGVAKKAGDRQIPAYQLHFGGRIGQGEATIGEAVEKIPARNVPLVVAALMNLYQGERREVESFADFAARLPRESLHAVLKPFTQEGTDAQAAVDWGQDAPFSTEEMGTGECAGSGIDAAVAPFDNYEAELRQTALFMEREQWVDALANLNRSQYTLARILLERLGKHTDSDYETTCELRSQVIDRGYASDLWNDVHREVQEALRRRSPEPGLVTTLHRRALDLLEEARTTLPRLDRKKDGASQEMPG